MMQKYVSSKLSIYLIFCIVLQIAVPQFLKGQIRTDDKEISVSCGNYSFTDRICIGLNLDNDHGEMRAIETSFTYLYFVSFKMYLGDDCILGLTGGTQSFSFQYYREDVEHLYDFSCQVSTLAIELKRLYVNKKNVNLYGFIGIGGRYYTEKISVPDYQNALKPYSINTQWTPIGISVGNTISAFFELGIGYKGFINGGLNYKIHAKGKKREFLESLGFPKFDGGGLFNNML